MLCLRIGGLVSSWKDGVLPWLDTGVWASSIAAVWRSYCGMEFGLFIELAVLCLRVLSRGKVEVSKFCCMIWKKVFEL